MDLFGKMAVFLGGAAGILAPPEQLGAHLLSGPIRARPAKKESAAIASGAPCRGAGTISVYQHHPLRQRRQPAKLAT